MAIDAPVAIAPPTMAMDIAPAFAPPSAAVAGTINRISAGSARIARIISATPHIWVETFALPTIVSAIA